MKREKLFIFILALILLTSFVSATDSCSLVAKSSCTGGQKTPILYLYSSTNSHAMTSWASGSSESMLALCCNFKMDKGCTTPNTYANEILSLSSPSNAHAEIPSLNNAIYGTRVCYGDLECMVQSSNTPPSDYPIKMISLSSETNAHVGGYNDYAYKISCRHKSSTPPGGGTLESSNVVFPNNLNSNLNLNQNQLGTPAAKVNIKLSNINANQGTPIYLEIYERDLAPSTGGGGASGAVIMKLDSENSFFNQIIQSLIQITGKITGHAVTPPANTGGNYIYTPIRTGNERLSGTLNSDKTVTFTWTINSSDISRAGTENSYDFVFKAINGNDFKRYDNSPLKVNINGNIPPGLNKKEKAWLDNDKKTKIKTKQMKWSDLPSSGGGNTGGSSAGQSAGSTGGVIFTLTGNVVINENLIYMNASGLSAVPNSVVYFEIWEKDSQDNDSIRTGSKSIPATVDSNQNAVASFYVTQADINAAVSDDPKINNIGNYEMFFKIRNSTNYYYPLPEGTYSLLDLKILYSSESGAICGNGICEPPAENSINCPQDCPTVQTQYLTNAQGMWANNEFTAGITQYVYQNDSSSNVVGMYVYDINPAIDNNNIYFEIWEKDNKETDSGDLENNSLSDLDDPIIVDGSLTGTIINGTVSKTWTITPQNLADAGNETYYEFYFKIRYLSESKSFRNSLLNVTINSSTGNNTNNTGGGGGGGGNYCDNINYCSDYATETKCSEDPCYDVLENEFALSPEADCSNPNVNCYCYWASDDECKFNYDRKSATDLGICNFIQLGVQDDCENSGLIITSYEATWNWSAENCYNNSNDCTDAIINAIEESCLQKDGCWRKTDYAYENCTNYEESVACSPAGGLDDDEGLGGDIGAIIKNKNNWWILLIIGIVIVGIIIFFVVRKLKKGDDMIKLFKTKENFNNILNYIKNARAQKIPDSEIRKQLLRVGWTEQQIAYAVKKSAN